MDQKQQMQTYIFKMAKIIGFLLAAIALCVAEDYHIVSENSTSLCHEYENGTCFTMNQFAKADFTSEGRNVTLKFFPGKHELSQTLVIQNSMLVKLICSNQSMIVLNNMSMIILANNAKVKIEQLAFTQNWAGHTSGKVKDEPDETPTHTSNNILLSDSYALGLNKDYAVVEIENSQNVTISNVIFSNNTIRALHVTSANVSIHNSNFLGYGGAALFCRAQVVISSTKVMSNNKSGIIINTGNVRITNSELSYNQADYGGAVRISSGNLSVSNSELRCNRGIFGGAILANMSNLSIASCTLKENTAFFGGAILGNGSKTVPSNVTIAKSELVNNAALKEGGVSLDLTHWNTSNHTTSSNQTTNMTVIEDLCQYFTHMDLKVTPASSNIHNNSGYGGAVVASLCNLSINDSNILNNNALYGGGILGDKSTLIISTSNLTSNRAIMGGGVFVNDANFTEATLSLIDPSNLTVINSTLTNNSAHCGGAIFVALGTSYFDGPLYDSFEFAVHHLGIHNMGIVLISGSRLADNQAVSGYGGSIYIETGDVRVTRCIAFNNKADISGGSLFIRYGNVSISDTNFTHNIAYLYGGGVSVWFGSAYIYHSEFNSNTAGNSSKGYGGAIAFRLVTSIISECAFQDNRGLAGGAIFVQEWKVSILSTVFTYSRGNAAMYIRGGHAELNDIKVVNNIGDAALELWYTIAVISNSVFNQNSVKERYLYLSGTIYISMCKVTFSEMNVISNNNGSGIVSYLSIIYFTGLVNFSNNHGRNFNGGALAAFLSQIHFNSTTEESVFFNNSVKNANGGAIFIAYSTLSVCVQRLTLSYNVAINGSGIYAYHSNIDFSCKWFTDGGINKTYNSSIVIRNNYATESGGGIWISETTIQLFQISVFIHSNSAIKKGGGTFLQQNSNIYLVNNAKKNALFYETDTVSIKITNNSAQYGGGIFVADETNDKGACMGGDKIKIQKNEGFSSCFIQILYDSDNSIKALITTNIATISGMDLYGGLLDRCTSDPYKTKFIRNNSIVSSDPVQVKLCTSPNVFVQKGELFRVGLRAVDQVERSLNATIISSVVTRSGIGRLKEGQAEQSVMDRCTELEFNVFSEDSSAQLEVYADGPCKNLGISKKTLNITFLPCNCSMGFQPSDSIIQCKCECEPKLLLYVTNCSNGTFIPKLGIWLGVIDTTNRSGYIAHKCPFDYCDRRPIRINFNSLNDLEQQCANNRSDILCGNCQEGLSLVFASSKCTLCSNIYLLLVIPFAIAGLFLVAIILLLNITVATGTIHGLIFYANVVAANKAVFLPFNNFLTVFISWVNLDFGIETCFYNGMNSQAKVLLQLVFPAYLFLLMFLIIVVSKYSDYFSKLLSSVYPLAGLCTLFLLSYSKLVRFIVSALQFTILDYPDNSKKLVWLYDANVDYFSADHRVCFVATAIILFAGSLYTILLFFGQWLPRCSECKVMKWTRNTRYTAFMDAYHAPFTPKHRYWLGLLLLSLTGYNIVTALATDIYFPVIFAAVIANTLAVLKLAVHPVYKNPLSDRLETVFLFNLAVLAYGTSYVQEMKGNQYLLANLSMAISFVIFLMIFCYNFHKYCLKKTRAWQNRVDTIRQRMTHLGNFIERESDERDPLLSGENYANEQREPVDIDRERYGVNANAHFTPPSTPTSRLDQLREPDLDVLAPVTTWDYKPAPRPPPRNPPVVTHTIVDITNKDT